MELMIRIRRIEKQKIKKRRDSKYQGMKVIKNKDLQDYIEEKIRRYWSSENISDRIKILIKT